MRYASLAKLERHTSSTEVKFLNPLVLTLVFFTVDLWPKREAREPYKSTGKKNEVSKILIISLRLIGG